MAVWPDRVRVLTGPRWEVLTRLHALPFVSGQPTASDLVRTDADPRTILWLVGRSLIVQQSDQVALTWRGRAYVDACIEQQAKGRRR